MVVTPTAEGFIDLAPLFEQALGPLRAEVAALRQELAELRAQPAPTAPTSAPVPRVIALKDSAGRYVCADRDYRNSPLLANRKGLGAWEQFTLEVVE